MRLLLALLMLVAGEACARSWDFTVLLDGQPVGRHRFVLEQGRLTSNAEFEVRFLGMVVYRYRHEAVEQWRGDCLRQITSTTEDDGKRFEVDRKLDGCAMSFAYWNPAMLKHSELLNAQTGQFEAVSITAVGEGRYRITGTKSPIELQYSPAGEWTGLDSIVASGRRLSYRLR